MSRESGYIDRVMADKDRAPKMAPAKEPTTMILCGPKGCDHQWDGPWHEFEDGLGGEATCSKCGTGALNHSLWTAD